MIKKRIYVGCALTHASNEFKAEVSAFKDALREAEFEVLDFIGLKDGSPEDVYRHDIYNCVAKCDLFIAICDLPSLGLGWEMGAATLCFKKPVLAVAHENALVTRLVQGCYEDGYELIRYRNLLEVVEMARVRLISSAA